MILTDAIAGSKKTTTSPVIETATFISETNLALDTAIHAFRFSRDFQYAFVTTSSSSKPQYILKIINIADPSTWTLHAGGFYNSDFRGGHISNDGTRVYGGVTTLYQGGLNPAYSGNYSNQGGHTGLGANFIGGVQMNPDETKLFLCKYGTEGFYSEWNLSNPGILSSRSLVQTKPMLPYVQNEKGFAFCDGGWGILSYSNKVLKRTVSEPYTLNGLSEAIPITGTEGYTGFACAEINEIERLLFVMNDFGSIITYNY